LLVFAAILARMRCQSMSRTSRSRFNRNLRCNRAMTGPRRVVRPEVSSVTSAARVEIHLQRRRSILAYELEKLVHYELRGRMRKLGKPAVILGFLLTLLAGATAIGDDVVALTLRVSNDSTDDILVTVYDMNADPPGAVIVRQRINGFAWIPVSVSAGRAGFGHVQWTATSAAGGQHRCGQHDMRGLGDDDAVPVFADSPCVPRANRGASEN
jgi:hypothetical protein